MQGAIVAAIDSATKDNVCYWFGRLRTSGESMIEDLAWDKFSIPPKSDADQIVHDRFVSKEPLIDRATHVDIELQNPTSQMPEWVAKKAGIGRRLYAGNIRSHTLAHKIESTIRARRRALGLPMPEVRYVHPKTKFFTFGLECPKKKTDRKKLAERFVDEFFAEHANDRSYDRWKTRFETHFIDEKTGKPKKDDAADCRMAGMARMVRMRAGFDKKKK